MPFKLNKDQSALLIRMDTRLKKQLLRQANSEKRSLSKMAIIAIEKYIKGERELNK